MNSILSLIITLTASVFSGIVVFLFKNTLKRQQEKEEMREKEKATETALSIHRYDRLSSYFLRVRLLLPINRDL